MARDFKDDNQRRYQGRDDNENFGRHGESWDDSYSNARQQGGYQDRSYGQQAQQSDYNRYGNPGRGNDYGSEYGSGRFGGPGASSYGGYGGGQRYQDDRSAWNRQQQGFDHGSGSRQMGAGYDQGRDPYTSDHGERQYGRARDQGHDRFSEGFYGDASRFSQGGLRDQEFSQNRYQGQHHDPDYQQWRNEQLRNLDEDYESWRGERYKKFSDDFNTWRSNRTRDSDTTQQGRGGSAAGSTPGTSTTGSSTTGQKGKDGS
jgi:hypothetical protein